MKFLANVQIKTIETRMKRVYMFRTSYITRSHSPSLCLDKDSKSGKRKAFFLVKRKEKPTGVVPLGH